jgi:predicted N-acyltransferase
MKLRMTRKNQRVEFGCSSRGKGKREYADVQTSALHLVAQNELGNSAALFAEASPRKMRGHELLLSLQVLKRLRLFP